MTVRRESTGRDAGGSHQVVLDAVTGIDSLLADYLAGARVGELARRYGIHRSTVTAHLAPQHPAAPSWTQCRPAGRSRQALPRRPIPPGNQPAHGLSSTGWADLVPRCFGEHVQDGAAAGAFGRRA